MEVYFMLDEDDYESFGSVIRGFNRSAELTRHLYKFGVVKRGAAGFYRGLPEDMVDALKQNNVIVRCINNIHSVGCYALANIDFTNDIEEVKRHLFNYISGVCELNIRQLDVLKGRNTKTAIQACKKYLDMNLVSEVFEAALDRNLKRNQRQGNAAEIMENRFKTVDIETSHEVLQGAVDDQQSSKLMREYRERHAPEYKPEMTVRLTKVPAKGKKEKWGFLFDITDNNGTSHQFPLYLGNTDEAFLYAAVLFTRKTKDSCIYLNLFNSLENRALKFKWLRALYSKFYFNKAWNYWFTMATGRNNGTRDLHRIYQAKGRVNGRLWEKMQNTCPEAYYYCAIGGDKKAYKVHLHDENVEYDVHFASLFQEEFARL
jgi:hypothetical protein